MTDGVTNEDYLRRQDQGRLPDRGQVEYGRARFAGQVMVPRCVAVEQGLVVYAYWTLPGGNPVKRLRPVPQRLLIEFVALRTATDAAIETFAGRWGPLRLCKHGQPMTHLVERPSEWGPLCWDRGRLQSPELSLSSQIKLRWGWPLEELLPSPFPEPVYTEPIEAWRHWGQRFDAAVRLAEVVRQGGRGEWADWDPVFQPSPSAYRPAAGWIPSTVDEARGILAQEVNRWAQDAGLRPYVVWKGSQAPEMVHGGPAEHPEGGGSLFAALVWQVALALGRRDLRTVICSGCGEPFTPLKMPGRNQAIAYCPSCRSHGVPARERKRRQRQKGQG